MKQIIGLGVVLMLCVTNVGAVDFGVGAKVGTNGVGLDLSVGLTKTINVRLSAAALNVDDIDESITVGDNGAEGDIDAELDIDYGATAMFIDWHIFDSGFRLSVGMLKNHGKADISGVLEDSIIVDGQPLDPSDFAGDIGG